MQGTPGWISWLSQMPLATKGESGKHEENNEHVPLLCSNQDMNARLSANER